MFQNQGGSPCLLGLSLVCNGFLRFTSSATPADLLAASMAAEMLIDVLAPVQALVLSESGIFKLFDDSHSVPEGLSK